LFLIQFRYKRKITLCYGLDVANTETKRGENSIKISSTHVNSVFQNWFNPGEEISKKLSRKSRNRFCTLWILAGILWELVIPICDWFILIRSQGLVPRTCTVHTKRFEEQVAGTCPKNSSQSQGPNYW